MITRKIIMTYDSCEKGKGIYIDLEVWDSEKQEITLDSKMDIGFSKSEREARKIAIKLSEEYCAIFDPQIY